MQERLFPSFKFIQRTSQSNDNCFCLPLPLSFSQVFTPLPWNRNRWTRRDKNRKVQRNFQNWVFQTEAAVRCWSHKRIWAQSSWIICWRYKLACYSRVVRKWSGCVGSYCPSVCWPHYREASCWSTWGRCWVVEENLGWLISVIVETHHILGWLLVRLRNRRCCDEVAVMICNYCSATNLSVTKFTGTW